MRNIEYYKDLIIELTKKDIKVRYKNSYLGYLWSLANPLCLALIFYFIFKIITKVQMENYTLFLISGLFVWQWISNSVLASANIFLSNASLIKKVKFPRNFLVLSLVLSEGFNFLVSIPVIFLFMLYYKYSISLKVILLLPLLLFLTGILIYSLSLIIGTLNVFFRDLERIVSLLLTFIFYLTPIIYSEGYIPEKYKFILYINPFASVAMLWHDLFLKAILNFKALCFLIFYDILFYIIATVIYKKLQDKFAELV